MRILAWIFGITVAVCGFLLFCSLDFRDPLVIFSIAAIELTGFAYYFAKDIKNGR